MKLEKRAERIDELMIKGDLEGALQELRTCLNTENEAVLDNPYIHLRKGQCHYMMGDEEDALRELAIAYTLDGERIFEDEDPRFLSFLKERSSSGSDGPEGMV